MNHGLHYGGPNGDTGVPGARASRPQWAAGPRSFKRARRPRSRKSSPRNWYGSHLVLPRRSRTQPSVELPGARSSRQICLDCDKRIVTRLAKRAKVDDPIIPYRCEPGAAIGNSVRDISPWPTITRVYLSRTISLVRIVERNRELNAFGIGTYAKNKIEVRRGECAAKPGSFPDFHRINVLTKPPLRFGNRTWFVFRFSSRSRIVPAWASRRHSTHQSERLRSHTSEIPSCSLSSL